MKDKRKNYGENAEKLSRRRFIHVAAVGNATPRVQAEVRQQGGYVSGHPCGWGVRDALLHCLSRLGPVK